MHRDFTPFLRSDGLGIDYSQLVDYDTRGKLEAYLLSQHPVWKKRIEQAIKSKDIEGANYGLEMAGRIGLTTKEPDFIAEARKLIAAIRAEKRGK